VPVLDQVRARAQALNLSLADLDEMCGGYSYWGKEPARDRLEEDPEGG
jgi:hypothetical protein